MPVLNRGAIPDIIDTRPLWLSFLLWKQNPKSYTALFFVSKEEDAHVDIIEFSGLGRFQTKPEGTPVTYDIPVQGRRRRVVHSTYALGTAMTREAVDDAKFNVLDRQSEALSRSQLDHEERLAWALLDASFTTGLSIDGTPIISTSHVALKTGAVQSNQLSPHIPLSYEGLEAASVRFLQQQSNEGHFIGQNLKGATIVANVTKVHIANNIVEAKGRPGTTNTFDTNQIAKQGLSVEVSPYLTSAEAWWLMGAKGTKGSPGNGFTFNNRAPYRMTNSTDADTGDRKWRGDYRASVFNREWRENVGSTP